MDDASRSAILTAVTRAMHAQLADEPLLDDAPAAELYTTAEAEQITEVAVGTALAEDERDDLGEDFDLADAWRLAFRHGAFAASSVVRNRYAEDCLGEAVSETGVDQYVIVGAGLDTFAVRRPDLAAHVEVFELDHPATQELKRERVEAAGLEPATAVHYVPVDLEAEPVASALEGTAYDPDRPAFFSWLGVTPYLSPPAIYATLESIADCSAPGSELVFDFADRVGSDPEATTPRIRRFMRLVESMGEPTGPGLPRDGVEAALDERGFDLREVLGPADQRRRYVDDQADYFRATEHYHFVRAAVR